MYPYPTNVREEVGTLLTVLTNPGAAPTADAIHAGWTVVGFGLSLGFAGGAQPLSIVAASADSESDCQRLADALRPLQTSQDRMQAVTVPWGLILPLLFQFLQKWLVG